MKTNEWISVEKELPPVGERVEVKGTYAGFRCGEVEITHWRKLLDDEEAAEQAYQGKLLDACESEEERIALGDYFAG